MLILLFCEIFALITETISPDFDYNNIIELPTIVSRGVENRSNDLILHNKDPLTPPLITFKKLNHFENWSFEMEFNQPKTKFPEKAVIKFWYTDNHLDENTSDEFVGLMAGMEFHGDYASMLIAINESGEDEEIMREELPRNLLEGRSLLKLKVIYTNQNFKLELYDGQTLLHDHLRIYAIDRLKHLHSEMHVHVSAEFRNAPGKYFLLKNVKLFERIEDTAYDRFATKSEVLVDTQDDELMHAISALEYFMNYVILTFGTQPEGTTILRGIDSSLKQIGRNIAKLDDIKERLLRAKRAMYLGDLPARLNSLDSSLSDVIRDISKLDSIMNEFESSHMLLIKRILMVSGTVTILALMIAAFTTTSKPKKD